MTSLKFQWICPLSVWCGVCLLANTYSVGEVTESYIMIHRQQEIKETPVLTGFLKPQFQLPEIEILRQYISKSFLKGFTNFKSIIQT